MKDILQEIVEWKRGEIMRMKNIVTEKQLHTQAEKIMGNSVPSLCDAITASATGIIAEFKRKSPSKGWINRNGKAGEIPLSYQNNGAAAVSILTDNRFFGGADDFVCQAISSGLTVPVLYKNFIIDEYQLFQARLCGAAAVLLIAACLSKNECRRLTATAKELGMEVLLEIHNVEELEYTDTGPDIIGVNNRNLDTFETNVENSFRMAEIIPGRTVRISESGISSAATVNRLKKAGYSGFLIGESFMRDDNPGESLNNFISEL